MGIDLVKEINCPGKDIPPSEIIKLGDFFSGSIYFDDAKQSWVQFSFVNKEKMNYILNDIKPETGVHFEIQIYVKDSEKV